MTNDIKGIELQRLATHIKKIKANDTNVYHNARLLLRMYSDVVWNMQTDLNELSEKYRIDNLIKQIKDPYCFKYGDMVVRVQFQGNTSLEDKIVNHYKNNESIHSS